MHFLQARSVGLFVGTALGACALVVACSSSDPGSGGDDGGSSGSSGFAETGTSGGEGGTSGTSGSSGDGSTKDGAVPEKTCDPAKTDCAATEVCTDIGRGAPVCRPGCKNDAECTGTPKGGCVILTPGTPDTGACIPTCKPYGTDCAGGFTCSRVPEQAGVAQTSPLTFCKKTGATALGSNCANDPGSCGVDADCIFFQDKGEGVNDSKCHTLCDPTHPCGAGKGVCYTKTGDSFGFCHDG